MNPWVFPQRRFQQMYPEERFEFFKEEDMKYFGKLVHSKPESLNDEEKKELNAMKLVLKIKMGRQ